MDLITYNNIFFIALPVVLLMVLGAYYRYSEKMSAEADETLFWLVIHFLAPCLIIDSFMANPIVKDLESILIAPILGAASALIGLGISYGIVKKIKLPKASSKKTFLLCTSFYNYGYIPIPIAIIFFSRDVLAMLLLFNVGMEISLWTIGVMLVAGKMSWKKSLKKIFSPPLIALTIALVSNFFFTENPLPKSVSRLIHMIGQGTAPFALLVVGAMVFDHIPSICSKEGWAPVFWATFARLLCIPACFIAITYYTDIPNDLKSVLCIQAGMPSAVIPIIFIKKYSGDLQLAIRIVVLTTILSMLTMPFWVSLAFAFKY